MDDPNYLPDDKCLEQFKHSPLIYIMASDSSQRETIEQGGNLVRYYEARQNWGQNNFKNLGKELIKLASDNSLEAMGMHKEMT